MSLLKYKVLQSGVKDGVTNLPEKAIPVGVVPDVETGLPTVAFMMLYSDWAVEFPEEAKLEAIESAATSGEDDKKDHAHAQ